MEGSLLDTEPSMILGIIVEGPALVIEPSAKSAFIVEGSTLGSRTIRDSGPKCGRFGPGEWNQPRNGALAWKVQLLDPEPSVICVFIADGCFVYIELSTKSAFSVEGSNTDTRTVRDMCLYRGRLLCLHRTVHDIGL